MLGKGVYGGGEQIVIVIRRPSPFGMVFVAFPMYQFPDPGILQKDQKPIQFLLFLPVKLVGREQTDLFYGKIRHINTSLDKRYCDKRGDFLRFRLFFANQKGPSHLLGFLTAPIFRLAETRGFEPRLEHDPTSSFRNCPLRPLG